MYLALDQSLTNTGLAFLKNNEIIYGTIKTESNNSFLERTTYIIELVKEVIDKNGCSTIFIEQPFLFKTTSAAISLIKLAAILEYEFSAKYNLHVMSTVKTHLNSWTRAMELTTTKKAMQELLSQYFSIKLNSHEADAIGILLGGLKYHYQIENDLKKLHLTKLKFKTLK